jgi:hypothetical protein
VGKGKKQPAARYVPTPGKTPVAVEQRDTNAMKPAWRLARMEMKDLYGWHEITADDLRTVQQRLQSFETMTWNEILVLGRKQNHPIAIGELCSDAQKRIEELQLARTGVCPSPPSRCGTPDAMYASRFDPARSRKHRSRSSLRRTAMSSTSTIATSSMTSWSEARVSISG